MINVKRKDIVGVTVYEKVISKIYQGSKLVWEVICSCFGSGWWINNRPWINNNTWKNK